MITITNTFISELREFAFNQAIWWFAEGGEIHRAGQDSWETKEEFLNALYECSDMEDMWNRIANIITNRNKWFQCENCGTKTHHYEERWHSEENHYESSSFCYLCSNYRD